MYLCYSIIYSRDKKIHGQNLVRGDAGSAESSGTGMLACEELVLVLSCRSDDFPERFLLNFHRIGCLFFLSVRGRSILAILALSRIMYGPKMSSKMKTVTGTAIFQKYVID